MGGIIRVPSLLEQSLRSQAAGTNEAVKSALEIGDPDLGPIETEIENLEIRVDDLETDFGDLSTIVADVSGNLSIDINNLDVSLTAVIAEQCLRADSPPVTGSETTVIGSLTVQINGVQYRLALV